MQEPRIETKSAMRLMGVHATFISGLSDDTNAPDVIGPLWGRFNARAAELPAVEAGVCYGYTFFGAEEARTHPEELEYVAGVEVPIGAQAPEGTVAVHVPEALYAVFEHRGVMWTFRDTLLAIYRDWLPNSDYLGNGIGDVERYDKRWVPDSEDSVFEIWCGIKPKD